MSDQLTELAVFALALEQRTAIYRVIVDSNTPAVDSDEREAAKATLLYRRSFIHSPAEDAGQSQGDTP